MRIHIALLVLLGCGWVSCIAKENPFTDREGTTLAGCAETEGAAGQCADIAEND